MEIYLDRYKSRDIRKEAERLFLYFCQDTKNEFSRLSDCIPSDTVRGGAPSWATALFRAEGIGAKPHYTGICSGDSAHRKGMSNIFSG